PTNGGHPPDPAGGTGALDHRVARERSGVGDHPGGQWNDDHHQCHVQADRRERDGEPAEPEWRGGAPGGTRLRCEDRAVTTRDERRDTRYVRRTGVAPSSLVSRISYLVSRLLGQPIPRLPHRE